MADKPLTVYKLRITKMKQLCLTLVMIAAAAASFAFFPDVSRAGDWNEENVTIDFDVLENFRKPLPPAPEAAPSSVIIVEPLLPPPLPARKPPAPRKIVQKLELPPPSPTPIPKSEVQPIQKPPEPVKPAASKPVPQKQEQEQAPSIPPPVPSPAKLETVTINYRPGEISPPLDAQEAINTKILAPLEQNPQLRMAIISYASPEDEGQSSARRISLARGIVLRKQLIQAGIKPDRIDIKPRGAETQDGLADRVDLEFVN